MTNPTIEKIYYPTPAEVWTKEHEAEVDAFYAKVHEIEAAAVEKEYEQGDFYDLATFHMPDGTIWKELIRSDYLIPYSLEHEGGTDDE